MQTYIKHKHLRASQLLHISFDKTVDELASDGEGTFFCWISSVKEQISVRNISYAPLFLLSIQFIKHRWR